MRHIRLDFPFPVFLSDLLDFPLKIEYFRNPKFATFFARKVPIWARSSAGRALRSHRRGRGFDPLRVHQMDIGRTPIVSKAALPSWCGSDVKTNSGGQGIKALASAVLCLFGFGGCFLPFYKLTLALFAFIMFLYPWDKEPGKGFYDSLRQFNFICIVPIHIYSGVVKGFSGNRPRSFQLPKVPSSTDTFPA